MIRHGGLEADLLSDQIRQRVLVTGFPSQGPGLQTTTNTITFSISQDEQVMKLLLIRHGETVDNAAHK